ncbi:MAG: CHASE2 domain-containing protein [Okeania sp. SIO3I5]|uniref:CHASE2 domain-containing protein n=1 Tax=Okeania sp. SIO3I5 TaxID=2607805 RepID=UPI0013B685F9|nr:CHASE2 domain-containing protein [Okeania sp. SIO3I5]NEQ37226.1 CHASE2 domain-containing protein [Okeania sp. SIO3I5]
MSQLVVLKILDGNWENGFPVHLSIGKEGKQNDFECKAHLPKNSEISFLYEKFQFSYQKIYPPLLGLSTRIELETEESNSQQETNVNPKEECEKVAQKLESCLNEWLDSKEFRPAQELLLKKLYESRKIRFIIQTDDISLQRLPWHRWRFFDDYNLASVVFSGAQITDIKQYKHQQNQLKILAIFGEKELDYTEETQHLEEITSSEIHPLNQPRHQDINDQLWEKNWDILYFAGHSRTEQDKGKIYINDTESLTIAELKYGLKQAIAKGLQLAIFNSCDGLGLASELVKLQIPHLIVMREIIPNNVAKQFLKYLLEELNNTENQQPLTLNLAVQRSQQKLQGLETDSPYASWLPVLFQNPTTLPPTLQQLRAGIIPQFAEKSNNFPDLLPPKFRPYLKPILLATVSIFVTLTVSSIRHLGILEYWELKTYDQLMRLRPDEGIDNRLLVIEVTENDLQYQREMGMKTNISASLSDTALTQILAKLKPHQPRAIGLDIYRDFPVFPEEIDLAKELKENIYLFVICKHPESKTEGVKPPPEVPKERVKFSDVIVDRDGIIRRYLWQMEDSEFCPTKHSLSMALAQNYLSFEGIKAEITPESDLRIGQVLFQRIQATPAGGYQNIDHRGYQMLLNYRSRKIAESVTLKQVLQNEVDLSIAKDKIVIIGVTADSIKDNFFTPYSLNRESSQEMRGVFVQAQMTSQIISAVLDDRSLLKVWQWWVDGLWIWSWSVIGGTLVSQIRSVPISIIVNVVAILILYGSCLFLLIQGYWVPLIPAALGQILSSLALHPSHIKSGSIGVI